MLHMKTSTRLKALALSLTFMGTGLLSGPLQASAVTATAPGAPGLVSNWAPAAKTGIGTAYEPYRNGQAAGASKVWFSVADGMLTETMYGLIHEAQVRTVRMAVRTSAGLIVEGENTTSRTEYLYSDEMGRPLAPSYRLITRDKAGTVEIEKRIFTDPDRNVLFMRIIIRPLKGLAASYLVVEPHMANTSVGDAGEASATELVAHEGADFLTIKASHPFAAATVGFNGVSDGLTDLKAHGRLTQLWNTTGAQTGSILLTAELSRPTLGERTFDVVLGFGANRQESKAAATGALKVGYQTLLAHYNGQNGQTGWSTYLSGLSQLPRLAAQATDGGRLAYASALALKVQEDKTHAGALIASLSNPWGDTVRAQAASTGYKAVWPRDFYQCAMALAALGDRETPVAAFRYLKTVQVGPDTPGNHGVGGWFQQKSHVDGQAEWKGVQLDQTAMPIMLGWKLWKLGLITPDELTARYGVMIKPAADFLVDGGAVSLLDNSVVIRPPYSQQERWEEQAGYSPSTTAAVITGLTVAGDIADLAGDATGAVRYRQTADRYAAEVEAHMFTTTGQLGDGHYYLRIALNETPAPSGVITPRNGLSEINADAMIDAGFLELVRYGVRRPDDAHVIASLKVLDDQTRADDLRVRYDFSFPGEKGLFPGFRRYGHDGYGEDQITGGNYGADNGKMSAGQRGRVWPLLTGERGHYALALAGLKGKPSADQLTDIRNTYVHAMERFANQGLMLPEQVNDGVGAHLAIGGQPGQGTNSATPLAWAHAEYVKLLRSIADGQVFDVYAPVQARYATPGN